MNPLHESREIMNLWKQAKTTENSFKSVESKFNEELRDQLEEYNKKIQSETKENKDVINELSAELKIQKSQLLELEHVFEDKKRIFTRKIKDLHNEIESINKNHNKMLAHYTKLQEDAKKNTHAKIQKEKEQYSKKVNNHRLQIQKIGTPLRKNPPIPNPRGTRSRSAALRENRSRNRSVERGTTSRTRSASRGSRPRSASKTTYSISL
jgi:hypothetical protein